MNTANQVVIEAVAKLNAGRTEQVQAEAIRLISCIETNQKSIEYCNIAITDLRVEANKLASTVVNEVSVLGVSLPDNANKETITAVIAKANKDRQYTVEQAASRLTKAITEQQDSIVALEKSIKEHREALLKLTVPVITVEQVVGN